MTIREIIYIVNNNDLQYKFKKMIQEYRSKGHKIRKLSATNFWIILDYIVFHFYIEDNKIVRETINRLEALYFL